ncbi:MAG: HD domain-containing protein [Bdellovibrionales bacterium]|nr:HD domain-containing protein [Bdellovibrionales bacterium]
MNENVKEIEDSKYLPIKINSIHPSTPVPFDIFVLVNKKYIHYLRSGDHLNEEKISKLNKKAPESFFILSENKASYKSYIHNMIAGDTLSAEDKAIVLRESSQALVEELFESPDIESALIESKGIITNFVQFIDEQPSAMKHLIGLSTHDFYTYNHSLDVGIYCLGLGHVVGYNLRQLQELGEGALFHDIGKRKVSIDIICKNGPLDDIEWAQMQKHPEYGLAILNEFDFISDAVRACCFEHHENFMGNGYPQQLDGEDIHPFARMVALTDTFDALTTKRSYNTPLTPAEALEFMKTKLAGKYDEDLLSAMYDVLFSMNKTL